MNGKTGTEAAQTAPRPSARSPELVHRLADARVEARYPRTAADGAMLAWLPAVLEQALASGEITPLCDTGWWIRCSVYLGRLRCHLWRVQWSRAAGLPAPDPAAAPHVRLTVTAATGDVLPLLESTRAGIMGIRNLVLADVTMSEAPGLERSIAWAWLAGGAR